jgi:hypothetical protein
MQTRWLPGGAGVCREARCQYRGQSSTGDDSELIQAHCLAGGDGVRRCVSEY